MDAFIDRVDLSLVRCHQVCSVLRTAHHHNNNNNSPTPCSLHQPGPGNYHSLVASLSQVCLECGKSTRRQGQRYAAPLQRSQLHENRELTIVAFILPATPTLQVQWKRQMLRLRRSSTTMGSSFPPATRTTHLASRRRHRLIPSSSTGLPQIRYLHLPKLRRHSPRPGCAHFLRPLHHHGRLQDSRDPAHGVWR